MKLSTTAFDPEGRIPDRHTCRGENFSPPLTWHAAPPDARSFTLIMEDPDASGGTFTHWVIFNIPPDQNSLPENDSRRCPQGLNSFGNQGYGGPCPPRGQGPHRYYFKLYALDRLLDVDPGMDKDAILAAMRGHILDRAELMGTYEIT